MAHARTPHIPVADCKVRGVYWCFGRNYDLAVWDGEEFIGIREKFGHEFLSQELHHDSDPNFGTVQPLVFIELLPDDIELKTTVPTTYNGQPAGKTYAPLFKYLEELPKRCPKPKLY